MKTMLLNLKQHGSYRSYIEIAAMALRNGELVAFPTETVYGLGVHSGNENAIRRIYEIKKRPGEKKLTLMIADIDDVKKYIVCFSDTAKKLMDAFWPGPLAIVFPLTDGADLSIRFPDNVAARDLIRAAKVPIVTTSANISMNPPATDAQQVLMDLDGKIHIVLDGGSTRFRSPSTVVRVRGETVEIVRQGIITETSIRSCLENQLAKV